MSCPSSPHSAAAPSIDAGEWFTAGRFAAILGMLIVALFPDVVSGARTFVFRDYGLFSYPLAYYYRESFWRGEIPLWNPLNNCGIPFLAQWNTLVCYPFSLFYLLFPLPWSLAVFNLLHLFLGGLGMYFLARGWTGHRLAASVAGIAYVFSGLTLNCLMWPHITAALGWMPWVVLAVLRAGREGGRSVALAGLVGAFQMLTGSPEIILFTWVMLAVLCVGEWIQGGTRRLALIARFAAVIVIVTALSAIQLLPFLDLLAHSNRDQTGVNGESPMPGSGWANFLVPLFRCYQSPAGVFFQPGQIWSSSYYVSLIAVLFATSAVIRVREPRVWLLAGTAALAFVLALGDQSFLYACLRSTIPPINFINFPIKFLVLVTFILPLLAAVGLAELLRSTPRRKSLATRSTVTIWSAMIALIGGIIWFAHFSPQVYEQWPVIWKNGLVRGLFLTLALGAALRYALAQTQTTRKALWLALGLIGVIWTDVATHVPSQNPTVKSAIYQPCLADFRPADASGRAMLSPAALDKFSRTLLADTFNTYLGHRMGLYFDCNLLEGVAKVDGFYPLYVSEQLEALFALYAPTNGFAPGLADFIGVNRITSSNSVLQFDSRSTPLPLTTIGQKPIFAGKAETLIALAAPEFNSSQMVYLPEEAKPFVKVTERTEAKIVHSSFAAHQLDIKVETKQPSLLVVAQSFYPRWRAYVDNRPVKLWRANHAFQALETPAGKHQVKLVYEDQPFRAGAVISGLALLGCLATGLRRKTNSPNQVGET